MYNLSSAMQNFILHFGEMGSRWGINRTVGQIYALLYLSKDPLNADQIVEALRFSRSNVAMGIKELISMNLIMLKHIPNDRKDYYATHDDIWDVVRTLIEERRKREVDPTLTMLRTMIMEPSTHEDDDYANDKIKEMHDLIEALTQWYHEVKMLDNEKLKSLLNMGSKIYQLYQYKDKFKILTRGKGE